MDIVTYENAMFKNKEQEKTRERKDIKMKKIIALFLAMCFACMPATTCFAATKVDSDNTMASGWSSWTPGVTKTGDIKTDRANLATIVSLIAGIFGASSGSELVKAGVQWISIAQLSENIVGAVSGSDNVWYKTVYQYRTNASTNQIEEKVTTTFYYDSDMKRPITTAVYSHVEDIINRVNPPIELASY